MFQVHVCMQTHEHAHEALHRDFSLGILATQPEQIYTSTRQSICRDYGNLIQTPTTHKGCKIPISDKPVTTVGLNDSIMLHMAVRRGPTAQPERRTGSRGEGEGEGWGRNRTGAYTAMRVAFRELAILGEVQGEVETPQAT